jgi:crotonobetainyl-CoA:carnitine CoA-transferase CaiB-like acyl-CoA transferase
VPTLDEIVDDAAHHRGVLTEALHPVVGVYRQIGPPLVLSDTPVSVRRPAPLVAEHTEEVLAEAGYGPGEVDELVRSKVVRVRDEPSDVA